MVCRPNVAHVNSFGGPWDFTKETINMGQRGKGNCNMKWFTSCYLQVLHDHTCLLCLQPSWMVWRHTWGRVGSQTIFRWKSSSGLTTCGWHRNVQTKRKLLAVFQVSGVLHNVGIGKQSVCPVYLEVLVKKARCLQGNSGAWRLKLSMKFAKYISQDFRTLCSEFVCYWTIWE